MAPKQTPWRNKLAMVSGGSSGLGRHLALQLAEQGARLILIGREPERLENARNAAMRAGATDACVFAVDVADEKSWEPVLGTAAQLTEFLAENPVDLLINVVGRSDRGLLENLSTADLLDHFRVNVLSTFHVTKACLPSLKQTGGTVVDIASLAGIVAAPGMGAYSLAKHALVGMHRQWRLELHGCNVHFLLVCPGPIQSDDQESRYEALVAARGLDMRRARPGGGVRLTQLDPKVLAQQVLDAAARRQEEMVVPWKVRLLAAIMSFWPGWADSMVRKRYS